MSERPIASIVTEAANHEILRTRTQKEIESLRLEIAAESRAVSIANTGLDGIVAQRKAIDQAEKDLSQRLAASRLRLQTLLDLQEAHKNRVTQMVRAFRVMIFHELVKSLRISRKLTLRSFCQSVGFDASNWSKVERGINPPSRPSLEALERWFELEGKELTEFRDAAAIARGELPVGMSPEELLKAIRITRHVNGE